MNWRIVCGESATESWIISENCGIYLFVRSILLVTCGPLLKISRLAKSQLNLNEDLLYNDGNDDDDEDRITKRTVMTMMTAMGLLNIGAKFSMKTSY